MKFSKINLLFLVVKPTKKIIPYSHLFIDFTIPPAPFMVFIRMQRHGGGRGKRASPPLSPAPFIVFIRMQRHGGVRGEARFPPLDDFILLQKNIYIIFHNFAYIILFWC